MFDIMIADALRGFFHGVMRLIVIALTLLTGIAALMSVGHAIAPDLVAISPDPVLVLVISLVTLILSLLSGVYPRRRRRNPASR